MAHEPDTAAFEAFEAAGWQHRAEGYDRWFRPISMRMVEPLLDAAAVAAGTRLLDVGTGPGHVAGRAAARGAVTAGVDIAPAMVGIATAAWPAVRFLAADAHALPFRAGAFDAAVGGFAILHLGRPERGVAELARVLAPGGRLALTTWDQPARLPLLAAVGAAMESAGVRPPADLPVGPAFFRFADDAEITTLLRGGGFANVTVETRTFTYTAGDPGELWTAILEGTVRTAALVAGQPADVQAELRAAFVGFLEGYRVGAGTEVPFSVKLAAARRSTSPGSSTER